MPAPPAEPAAAPVLSRSTQHSSHHLARVGLVVAALAFAAAAAQARPVGRGESDDVVLKPTADNTIFSNAADNSFAKASCLLVGNGGPGPRRILIRFDLSSVPAGAQIISA